VLPSVRIGPTSEDDTFYSGATFAPQVLDRPSQNRWVLLQHPDALIAVGTEESPQLLRDVVVVQAKTLGVCPADLTRRT